VEADDVVVVGGAEIVNLAAHNAIGLGRCAISGQDLPMVFVKYFITCFITEGIPTAQGTLCCFPEFIDVRQVIKVLLRVFIKHTVAMSLLEAAVSSHWRSTCGYLPMIIVNELLQPLIFYRCLG